MALFIGLGWPLVSATVAVKYGQDVAWWKAVIATVVGWFWGLVILPAWFVFVPLTRDPVTYLGRCLDARTWDRAACASPGPGTTLNLAIIKGKGFDDTSS